ncbi:5510_t:CDS:2 [Ambispora gerdemannii]|uniref:5510_t:CDS:1 n=1 Tax=Ambispora gerdemannii TaxID=144530 RepID=A0A9N9C897_9GLOM|nr:5510_t:CDS:2 [Ambispora gerdemannii]
MAPKNTDNKIDNNNNDYASIDSNASEKTKPLGTLAGIGNNCNNMIGAGIFSSPGLVLNEIRSPGIALVLWVVGGIATLFGSLSYVELGSSMPDGGGETVYLEQAYPRPKALLSYMFSFTMIVAIQPAYTSAIASVFAQYFLYLVKATGRCDIDYLHPKKYITDWNFWQIRLCSLAAVVIVTAYHMASNKWANRINQTLTIIKMLTLLTISIIGLATIHQVINDEDTNWKNMFPRDVNISARSLTAALMPILFAYGGWNNLNYTLDEFVNPQKKLFASNNLCANIAYTNVPLNKITGNNEPSEIIAAFGALAANVWAGSRVIVAAAKRKYLPFSSQLKKWNEDTGTPIFALITQAAWSSLIIIFYPHNDPFKFFVSLSEYCVWVFLFLTVLGLLILRRSQPNLYHPFKVFTLIPKIFIIFTLFVIIGSFVNDSSKIHTPQPPPNSDQCDSSKNHEYLGYKYYLPYVVSLVVIGVGGISWSSDVRKFVQLVYQIITV